MKQPPLTPMSLTAILGRIAHEWESRGRIFDLPSARIWKLDPDVDLSINFLGRPAATPLGPAAGPHTQMAQNIVLAWLAGSRIFELKTVQILDSLEVARPCIDMQTIGYNIEWSQELTVPESIDEYVKAWMIIEILKRWDPLKEHLGPDTGAHVFDMSVGYDLAGIRSPKIVNFVGTMMDASQRIDALRHEIPEPFEAFRDLDFPAKIADTLTLSTFHGCPPDEIDGIVRHLIDEYELDVIVKLNPTLLGFASVDGLLHETLGYDDVTIIRDTFDADLQFDRAVRLITDLRAHAAATGRRFGIKVTNTLVVKNEKGWMPDDPMYLSGAPLHVLASSLLDRLIDELPGVFDLPGQNGTSPVTFSAGVTKANVADTVAMGVAPATMSTDLLKPGGYGRLKPMLNALAAEVSESGVASLREWRETRFAEAVAAGHRDWVASHVAAITGDGVGLYHKDGNSKLPRRVDAGLQMWGCVACNLCVTVCPNGAFMKLPTPSHLSDQIGGRWQYLVLAELCNECGNCLTFCPEDGDPAMIKPRLFLDESRFAGAEGQAFRLVASGQEVSASAAAGWESELATLTAVIAGDQGVPIRATDI
ncbi:MAG: 4Fe-4S dicluster domain-containing protein [Actinomycetota bacterium]|nr:4Fe-4S dicluster domain-containing protein [Actinomycetota bacterium]